MTKRVDVVQAAKDRIAELEAMQAQQDAERGKLNEFLAMAEKLASGESEVASAVAELSTVATGVPPTPVREIRKRAAAIIGAVNRPMPLSELHNALTRAGVVVGGKDPRSNLSAKLSGAPDLESLPGKGWVVRKDQGLADPARPYRNGAEASG